MNLHPVTVNCPSQSRLSTSSTSTNTLTKFSFITSIPISLQNCIFHFLGNYHTLRNVNQAFRKICEQNKYTYLFFEAWSPFSRQIPLSLDVSYSIHSSEVKLNGNKKRIRLAEFQKEEIQPDENIHERIHRLKIKLLQDKLLTAIYSASQPITKKLVLNSDPNTYVRWIHETATLLINLNFISFNNDLHSITSAGPIDELSSIEIHQQAEMQRTQLREQAKDPTSFSSVSIRFKKTLSLLPPEIQYYRDLEILDLSKHKLITLDKKIGKMTKLTDLFLQDNPELQELPKEICNLRELTTLNICRTQITTLPKQFRCLINLSFLYLDPTFPISDEEIINILPNITINRE